MRVIDELPFKKKEGSGRMGFGPLEKKHRERDEEGLGGTI